MALNLQTSYNEMSPAFAGMKADAGRDERVDSYAQGETTAAIPFGVAVCEGVAATVQGSLDTAILPADANSVFAGVNLKTDTIPEDLLDDDGVLPTAILNVMKRGRVWVLVEETVAKDDDAFFRHTVSGGNTVLGAFRTDADTAKATQVTNAKWTGRNGTAPNGDAIAELWFDVLPA